MKSWRSTTPEESPKEKRSLPQKPSSPKALTFSGLKPTREKSSPEYTASLGMKAA